jgi:transaldolase
MQFPSKIYIDGGDPAETKEADRLLKKAGYHGLDGQTTNPTLIAKRYAGVRRQKTSVKRQESSVTKEKISEKEAFDFYKQTVKEMAKIIPNGKISIQVIGDPASMTAGDMVSQARDRTTWIPNAIIKLPCTKEGLTAVSEFCEEGPVNVTLNFSQEQAAGVYAAAKTRNHDVFVSPFVGRLDDKGLNGMDIVSNILELYRALGDGHVQVITASVRNIKHIMYALHLKSDVITIPFKVFKEWADNGFPLPSKDYFYDIPGLADIPYKELTLDKQWEEYDIRHDLTDAGVLKFWEDWKSIVS